MFIVGFSIVTRNACHQSVKQKNATTSTEVQIEIDTTKYSDAEIVRFLTSVYEPVSRQLQRNVKNNYKFNMTLPSMLKLEMSLTYQKAWPLGKSKTRLSRDSTFCF